MRIWKGGGGSAYVSSLRSRVEQVVTGWWERETNAKRIERRRGTKYEMNSWNDGEERARERARRKQLNPDASTVAQRRMLRWSGSRGRRRKR